MNRQGSDKIDWCDYTVNPCVGCLHKCPYCYAKSLCNRFWKTWGYPKNPFEQPLFFPERFTKIYRANVDGKKIFLDSMSDLFGAWFWKICLEKNSGTAPSLNPTLVNTYVEDEIVTTEKVWLNIISIAKTKSKTIFQILTKDPANARKIIEAAGKPLPPNLWLGTSFSSQEEADKRIPELLKIQGAAVLFGSWEPALGDVFFDRQWLPAKWQCTNCGRRYNGDIGKCKGYHDINAQCDAVPCPVCGKKHYWTGSVANKSKLDWLIIGAQTGPRKIQPKKEWVQSAVNQCRAADVPVFVKHNVTAGGPWPQEFPG